MPPLPPVPPPSGKFGSRSSIGGFSHRKSFSNSRPVHFEPDEEDLPPPPPEDVPSSSLSASPNRNTPYPQRTRKRNKLIFGDEDEEYVTPVVRHQKQSKSTPIKLNLPPPHSSKDRDIEKKIAHRLGLSLRTLLKLPKAHKWVCYEWYYANIDQSLFMGENDFELYLRDSFPQLKTRMLKKVEWSKIRRLMGKPRRCSAAFFREERDALHAKRNKIRHLQQQKVVDISQYRDLPANIPLPLVIGARVTALLRKEKWDGLFTGTITAVDAVNGCYRIQFDRPGLGSHQVPDYEVLSNDPPEFMPLTSFQSKVRQRFPVIPNRIAETLGNHVDHSVDSQTSLAGKAKTEANINSETGMLGGFPVKFLVTLVRLHKILAVKKKKIYELKSMNNEAEKFRSMQQPLPIEFQKHYAHTVLDLEKLNVDLNEHLKTVQTFASDLVSESTVGLNSMQPEILKQRLFEEAKDFAERSLLNISVKNEKSLNTIAQLLSVVLHLRNFSDAEEVSSFELKTLTEAVQETKSNLLPENRDSFESQVEIHVNHIQSTLSHLGNLGAFAESVANSTTIDHHV